MRSILIVAFVSIGARILFATDTASFQWLGQPAGDVAVTEPRAISADGRTVVGTVTYQSLSYEAFRWNAATGLTTLGYLPKFFSSAGDNVSEAYGVSANGAIVAGRSGSASTDYDSVRWNARGAIGGLDTGGLAAAISYDGSVITGYTASPIAEVYRWTRTGVVKASTSGTSVDISGNGNIILGRAGLATGGFLWNKTGAITNLPLLLTTQIIPSALSGDGKTVIGNTVSSFFPPPLPGQPRANPVAVRWTVETGYQLLDPAVSSSKANDVSFDGKIVVGQASLNPTPVVPLIFGPPPTPAEASVWDASHGTRSIRSLLTNDFKLPLDPAWNLGEARAISADGTTVVGFGSRSTDGTHAEPWLAEIPRSSNLTFVSVDIKPDDPTNSINLASATKIDVAIPGTKTFNVKTLFLPLIRFGVTGTEAWPVQYSFRDFNKDGYLDLIVTFRTRDTRLNTGTTFASLTGLTFQLKRVEGTDLIRITP